MFLPSSLLEKVYVKGSLQNTEGGFEFKLKNIVDSGTLGGVVGLAVDETSYPLTDIRLKNNVKEFRADEVTFRNPVPLQYGAVATISVTADQLPAGEHLIALTLNVIEAGKLQIKVKDEIAAA